MKHTGYKKARGSGSQTGEGIGYSLKKEREREYEVYIGDSSALQHGGRTCGWEEQTMQKALCQFLRCAVSVASRGLGSAIG